MKEKTDILFFAAHADDLELSVGGTIARSVRDGLKVGMIDLTRGEMGTRGTPAIRKRESQAAARTLKAAFRVQLDFGDGGLQVGREQEMEIIDCVRRWRPEVIFAPWPDERHPDHARTGRIVTEASFYAGLKQLQSARPAHRPQAVVYYLQNYVTHPTFIVDVTDTWKTKMKAVAAYKSQFHAPGSKEPQTFISSAGFLEMIEARGKHFGALIGKRYGEGFVTRQPPQIDDVVAAYRGREV